MVIKSEVDLHRKLHEMLRQVRETAGLCFSGVGVVVSGDPDKLPIFPLRAPIPIDDAADTAAFLGRISVVDGNLHDGFHILSPDLQLTAVSQYFSPPILLESAIDRSRPFGGRYLAALFGSKLDGVIATGIATTSFGIATFAHGAEFSRDTSG